MNDFVLTRTNKPIQNTVGKEVSYLLRLEGPVPGAPDQIMSLVPQLFKMDKLPPFYHYRDVVEKNLINIDILSKQLACADAQMLANIESRSKVTGNKAPAWMPLPKPKR